MKKIIITIFMLLFIPNTIFAYTQAPIDITAVTILELQEYVDARIINYETIVNLYLDRIKEYDEDYNSINVINENAISIAQDLDDKFLENGRTSILYGMPILIKDNIDYESLHTTAGALALDDNMPLESADIIKNLEDAGAIILGKTNMSEFAFMASNSYSSYGYVKNAYNNSYTSYGSSGGSAVSAALSFATAAIGTDTNMSIRVPASGAGLYGIRPTQDLLSKEGIIAYDPYRDTPKCKRFSRISFK